MGYGLWAFFLKAPLVATENEPHLPAMARINAIFPCSSGYQTFQTPAPHFHGSLSSVCASFKPSLPKRPSSFPSLLVQTGRRRRTSTATTCSHGEQLSGQYSRFDFYGFWGLRKKDFWLGLVLDSNLIAWFAVGFGCCFGFGSFALWMRVSCMMKFITGLFAWEGLVAIFGAVWIHVKFSWEVNFPGTRVAAAAVRFVLISWKLWFLPYIGCFPS